jgi:lactobin A/cerein 7B family class IIb bacteriocin
MNTKEFLSVVDGDPTAAQQGEAVIQAILERSANDRAFRELLVSSPRDAVAVYSGTDVTNVPEWFSGIHFVESQASTTFVLPDADADSYELRENELETVAGGLIPLAVVGAYAGYVGLCAAGVWCGRMLAKALT